MGSLDNGGLTLLTAQLGEQVAAARAFFEALDSGGDLAAPITAARRSGLTWRQIGQVAGVKPAAAFGRWAHLEVRP